MTLYAIQITENSLDMIAEVNGGVRPEIEGNTTIFIWNDDPDGYNDIVTDPEFFANYWYDWNIMDNTWTEVKKF